MRRGDVAAFAVPGRTGEELAGTVQHVHADGTLLVLAGDSLWYVKPGYARLVQEAAGEEGEGEK